MGRHGQDGWPFIVSSAIAGAVALGATYRGKEHVARAAAAVAVASVIAGWGVAQWPYLIVPDLTAAEAAAPKSSLGPFVIGLVVAPRSSRLPCSCCSACSRRRKTGHLIRAGRQESG